MEITSYGLHNSNKSHDWFGKKKLQCGYTNHYDFERD